ncbi:hypothetical protein HQ590_15055 [bacterium]|nr:hypothetical protein [bacterium]
MERDQHSRSTASPVVRWMICLLCWSLAPASGFAAGTNSTGPAPNSTCDRVWVVTEHPLTPDQVQALEEVDSLLVMVPGVSSGHRPSSRRFLDQVRRQAGHDLAVFYDWGKGTLARRLVAPMATATAATRLIELGQTFQHGAGDSRPIDLLAHSAGTVVLNKAALEIVRTRRSVRFRHVLLLGTALDADAPLAALQAVSARVLNVHSAYDKVNRNINDRLGRLPALKGGPGGNRRLDTSLSGRLMRHHVFLASDPENWIRHGGYLATGQWPVPELVAVGEASRPEDLHRLALWVKTHPDQPAAAVARAVPAWLAADDLRIRYYGVVLAGLLRLRSLGPALKTMLAAGEIPVWLRKEIYQALGNLEDGRLVDFLRQARDRDPDCDEEIRDVLRALKRRRIEPVR